MARCSRTRPRNGDWAVWCPELPGCTSAGKTEQEALENIREAFSAPRNSEGTALYLEENHVRLVNRA